jgi:hypothetical protein
MSDTIVVTNPCCQSPTRCATRLSSRTLVANRRHETRQTRKQGQGYRNGKREKKQRKRNTKTMTDIPRVVDRFLRMEHVSNVAHVLDAYDSSHLVYSVCELVLACQVYQEESGEPTLCIVSQQHNVDEEQEQEQVDEDKDVYAFIDRVVDRECGTCVLWWSGECEGPSYQRMWQLMACYLVHCGWTPTQVGRFLVDVTQSTGTHAAQVAMDRVWRTRCYHRTL